MHFQRRNRVSDHASGGSNRIFPKLDSGAEYGLRSYPGAVLQGYRLNDQTEGWIGPVVISSA